MQLLISKKIVVLFLALFAVFEVFCNDTVVDINNESISIVDAEKKIENLINTSRKFEETNYNLSLDIITEAYNIAVISKHNDLIAKCDLQKGILLSKNNKTKEAITSLKKALAFYTESANKSAEISTLVHIGNTYTYNSQFNKSLLYYNSALAEFTETDDSLGIVMCYTSLGRSYIGLENNSTAISYFTQAIQISKDKHYDYYLAINYLELSKIQLLMNITDSILPQVNLSYNIAVRDSITSLEYDTYLLLSRYYSTLGDKSEATKQLSNYIKLKESVNEINRAEIERFLISLNDSKEVTETESDITVYFWILVVIILSVVIFIIYKSQKQKVLHNKRIIKSNTELDAFKENTVDLDEKIQLKTDEKLLELKQEISNFQSDKIALTNSLSNLEEVNHLKDRFLSKISHEIRNPLNGILGFSSILETELALLEDNSLFEFSNSITQSGLSLVSLLNNILDISRLNANSMALDIKKLNTNELIQAVVDTYVAEASLKGLKLIFTSGNIPEIYTDSLLFSKILSLILNNSVKFTEKGFIKVSHSFDEERKLISIFIKDTGIGIDKVYLEQVFEPFRQESLGYSTSYQGAGLGLPLAKKMTLKLDGDIKIESEKGSGTTIILDFPAFAEETVKKAEPLVTHKDSLPWEPLKVLVVEDDNMNQILYRKMLSKAHLLDIAKDGKVALACIEKQLKDDNYHLVLMDINLPPPWDGISLMKEIRKRWPIYKDIPFIAQTAYAITGNRKAMMDEGFDDYITKPIIKSTLIESVKSVINK